jgi:hypothetical protein
MMMKEIEMQVYVLTSATAYEGENLVGVYSSLEEAQYAAGHYAARSERDDRSEGYCAGGDYYNVYCVEVGRAGRWHTDEDAVWSSGAYTVWSSGE